MCTALVICAQERLIQLGTGAPTDYFDDEQNGGSLTGRD